MFSALHRTVVVVLAALFLLCCTSVQGAKSSDREIKVYLNCTDQDLVPVRVTEQLTNASHWVRQKLLLASNDIIEKVSVSSKTVNSLLGLFQNGTQFINETETFKNFEYPELVEMLLFEKFLNIRDSLLKDKFVQRLVEVIVEHRIDFHHDLLLKSLPDPVYNAFFKAANETTFSAVIANQTESVIANQTESKIANQTESKITNHTESKTEVSDVNSLTEQFQRSLNIAEAQPEQRAVSTLLSVINKHKLDALIERNNYYFYVNNVMYTSVTQLLEPYKPEFWKVKRRFYKRALKAADVGTAVHSLIEATYNRQPIRQHFDEKVRATFNTFQHFQNWFSTNYPRMKPYRTEWAVFNDAYRIAGAVDMIFHDGNRNFVLVDWKCAEKLSDDATESMPEPLSSWKRNKMNYYALQISILRWMIEQQYGMLITNALLVRLGTSSFQTVSIPRMNDDVVAVLNHRLA